MKAIFKRIYDKTYLEGGICHAWWMLVYNIKHKLFNFSLACAKKIAKSIENQARVRAIKELAIIDECKNCGIYVARDQEEFFKSQKKLKIF